MGLNWNATDMPFTDISVELWREYRFVSGTVVRVEEPQALNVSASGGHRIYTQSGRGFYIPAGFVSVEWQPREGFPTFVA